MILFLYGEDNYRSREKLKQIEEKFKKTDKGRVNLVKIDGERTAWKNIEKEILASPFLHDKKLVVVENFLKKKGQKFDEAAAFLREEKIPSGAVVVFWEEGSPDERTAIFKLLNKPKQAEKFNYLPPAKLNQWILDFVEKDGAKIEKNAVAALVQSVGSDSWQLATDIEKLIAYSRGKGKAAISAGDVGLLSRGQFEENIFNFTDALGNKNKKLAFKLLDEQIEAGLNSTHIFSMIVRQFRILLQVKETAEKNYSFISAGDPAIRQEISAELGIHPYVAAKSLYQIKNFTLAELKKIYGKLLAIDMKIKKTNISPRLLLDLFIAEICLS